MFLKVVLNYVIFLQDDFKFSLNESIDEAIKAKVSKKRNSNFFYQFSSLFINKLYSIYYNIFTKTNIFLFIIRNATNKTYFIFFAVDNHI